MSLVNRSHSSFSIRSLATAAGFVTLAFQIIVTRLLTQHFGIGSTAIASIVAVSLCGLALGAFAIGNWSDRYVNRIPVVGILFCLTAISIAAVTQTHGYIATSIDGLLEPRIENLAKHQLLFCLATVLPVNFLLGGILPTLVAIISRDDSGKSFASVYGSETAGAMLGALASGFFLIQNFGITYSLYTIAGLSLISSVACMTLTTKAVFAAKTNVANSDDLPEPKSWLFLAVVLLASCSSLGIEIIWQRYFVILFGSDTHSLAIVTASFLLGISIGALLSKHLIDRSTSHQRLYGLGLVTIAVCLLLSSYLLILFVDGTFSVWVASTRAFESYPILSRFIVALVSLLPPSIALGCALPVAAAYWIQSNQPIGKSTGEIYGTAILGNVIGVFIVGFFLIPAFGLGQSALGLSLLCVIGGTTILAVGSRNPMPFPVFKYISLVVGWGILVFLVSNHSLFLGIKSSQEISVDYYNEASENSVAVIRSLKDPDQRKMLIDGVAIGESGGGVDEKQQLLAHLPFLIRPQSDSQKVLTIGLGSGILAGELLECKEVATTTCVEISPAVVEAAQFFSDLNGNILENEDFELIVADGIRFLQVTRNKFDVIVSDAKSRPGHAGNVAFFSRDYYQLCASRLSDNGIFIQWIGLNTAPESLSVILNSFCNCFAYGHVAIAAPNSIFVIGSSEPLTLDKKHVEDYLDRKSSDSLGEYGWNSYDDLISMYWLDQTTIANSMVADAPINTTERPFLESFSLASFHSDPSSHPGNIQLHFLADLVRFDQASDIENSRFNSNALSHPVNANVKSDLLAARRAGLNLIQAAVLMTELKDDWLDASAGFFDQAIRDLPNLSRQQSIANIYRQLANRANQSGNINREFSALDRISDLKTATAEEELRLAKILVELQRRERALDYFYRAATKAPNRPEYRCEFGFCLLALERLDQAKVQFARILREFPTNTQAKLGQDIGKLKSNPSDLEARRRIEAALKNEPALKDLLLESGIALDSLLRQ